MSGPEPIVGLDFGTSNSALALVDADGVPRFAEFSLLERGTQSFRSLLFFDLDEQQPGTAVDYAAGPAGIEAYLEALGEGRLIQSFKTHLTFAGLGRTHIGPHAFDLDGLLVLFFRRLLAGAQRSLGHEIHRAVLGRPVHFAGAREQADHDRAQRRLSAAARIAGIAEVHVELEPIAAAYHYESTLERDELAMVADFGAGTTDFCVMRIGPGRRSQVDRTQDVLAVGGVGVAGDDLDAALIQAVVAPALGKGSHYREFGRRFLIPPSYYNKLSHWHQLSFLRGEQVRSELERLRIQADEPRAIEALIQVIADNQGFHLHESIEATKIALSSQEVASFHFEHDGLEIHRQVSRADFDTWVAPEVASIAACLDATLADAGLQAQDIDRVFMTGGTAFVPCVRREFELRFGADKLSRGDELSSIASGLAARGRRLDG